MTFATEQKRECVVLFARSARDEGTTKRILRSRRLFERSQRRIAEAVGLLPGVDLILSFVDRRDPCGETMAIAQRGSGFGERFHNAMSDAARLGYDHIVAIPIDVPELSGFHLQRALLALRESPFVLGPSPDGGVYLIGFHANAMPALQDISWNTNRVFAQLIRALPLADVIEPLADIDDASDVRALLSQHLLDPQLKALLRTMLNRAPAEREPARCLQPRLFLSRLPARAPPLG